MSLPTNKRGFRKIVIDGKEFNWRFKSMIQVCPAFCRDNKLCIDFGWFDHWLYVNGKEKPTDYDPEVVTPAFVREAIEFALKHHWNIEKKTGGINLLYRDKQFKIVSADEDNQ
jgi:hypothetical protein